MLHLLSLYSRRKVAGMFCFFFLGFLIPLHSQQLENLKDQQALTLGGYVSASQVLTGQSSDTSSLYTYNAYYTGSLNLSIYGISVPLTFIYSKQKGSFSHPFNQFGLHPSYKWVKAHVGYSGMSFSPYTLNGHLFMGAGLEADPPGLLRTAAFYGVLRRHSLIFIELVNATLVGKLILVVFVE